MATGSSIVGTWNLFVDWGCSGSPVLATQLTINANGSWTYPFGGGRWIQVEGMCFFNFSNAAGLVYTGNVTLNALVGIMGYALASPNPGAGCWWATRPGAPHALVAERAAAAELAAAEQKDLLIGPAKKPRKKPSKKQSKK